MIFDKRLLNVTVLGLAFMLIFTAFQTMGNIEKTVLDSITRDDPTFTGNGYTSLAIIYTVFALCNWLAPSLISVLGPRVTMLLGGIIYLLFIASFLYPQTWLLYAASGMLGAGAAAIWTAQGCYLTLNSDANTISRNSGIFWAMLQSSMFLGNTFVSLVFQGKAEIDAGSRHLVFTVLCVVAGLGVVVLAVLPRPRTHDGECTPQTNEGPLNALKSAGSLFVTKEMLLLCVTFLYTGFELSFYCGVYSSCIGFTKEFGDSAKTLVGMSGIFIGVGEVLGGVVFGLMGSRTNRWGRDPIVILGFIIHVVAFFSIYLNLPNTSPFGETVDKAHIQSSAFLAILGSLMLGLGDSCFNTQILSILGGMYPDDSAPAFAIFKFTQSLSAAGSFFYSNQVGLYMQLYMLAAWGTAGTLTFCLVENMNRQLRAYTPSAVVTASNKDLAKQT
ncbi:UNC93-like protein MFSD11 isoform X3 [Macrosteles quadrilineatus]|uniref:UNC93-like protein MFSD11 isoform X3 n=2 Tax=Macrosteles quadrilineatus TaxID=74068 RepID=UPI0023E09994|nr:UNC93-like protein MFSD11 isoform X3 [Macrosteles quadrilineatus]